MGDRGTALEATFVSFGYGEPATRKAPYVVPEKRDGQQITVPLARLCSESQHLTTEDVKKIRQAKE